MGMTETAPRPGCLSESQLQSWRQDGFLILHDFFPRDQITQAAEEAEVLVIRHRKLIDMHNLRTRFMPNVVTGVDEFECFDPVIDLSLACHRLALDPDLLETVGALHGEEACLFKDKLVYKGPGVKGYDLHQDYAPWDSFPRSFLTVLIPLDPADRENGCTEVFRGYHKNGLLRPRGKEYAPLPPDAVDEARAVPLILDRGDIAIFDGFTPHRSASNRSDRWRRQFFPSYNRFSEGGHQRPQHYQEFREWMRSRYAERGLTDMYYC
jgi:ectoine hydroxylase-related dioxygenase (phytanoyl-CoA dioxygenase family)